MLAGRLGNISYQKGDFRRAGEWYEKARQLYPESKAVYFNLAKVYESLADLKSAEAAYRHYWELCQGTDKEEAGRAIAALLRQRAEELLRKGEYRAALSAFQ